MDALSATGSILGMVLGTAGFALGILNYLRDRPRVRVTLQWNMTDMRTNEVRGLIRATNTGRRAVFVSIAALEIKGEREEILLMDSVQGVKLAEGDKPAAYFVPHEAMGKYAQKWRKIRAYVQVSSGEKYWSDYPTKDAQPPAWLKLT